jgi:cadmium resistance protein CadD (predicted permease)
MELVSVLVLFGVGFVAFFATGIDDTVAYAGSYLDNPKKDHKKLISFGIILGTIIALAISIFAGTLMERIPSRHLVGGAVLVTLGLLSFVHGKGRRHQKKTHYAKMKKHIGRKPSVWYGYMKFIGIGLLLFFGTGIDDILAYSNLIMAKGSWMAISSGVMIATFVSLAIAHSLSGKLKKFPHPERIGGVMLIIIGVLLALRVL